MPTAEEMVRDEEFGDIITEPESGLIPESELTPEPEPAVEPEPVPKPAKAFEPIPGSEVTERSATGEPTVYRVNNVDYYTPESTMWKMGYRTSEEYARTGAVAANPKAVAPNIEVQTSEGSKLLPKETAAHIMAMAEGNQPKASQMMVDAGLITEEELAQQTPEAQAATKEAIKKQSLEAFVFQKTHTRLPDKEYIRNTDLAEVKQTSPEIYGLLIAKGFKVANEKVKQLNAEYRKNMAAITKLEPYTDEEGMVDGAAFLKDNPKDRETLLDAGITPQDIASWRVYNEGGGVEVPKLEKVSIPKAVWQYLTPWRDEEGQTFLQYAKGHYLSKEPESQVTLRAEYDADKASPLWARALFPVNIIKDSKTGKYVRPLMGEPPLVGGVSLPSKVGRAAPKLVRALERVNWNDIAKAATKQTKARVDWNKLADAIKRGEVKTASDAAKYARLRAEEVARKIASEAPKISQKDELARAWARTTPNKTPRQIASELTGLPELEVNRRLNQLRSPVAHKVYQALQKIDKTGVKNVARITGAVETKRIAIPARLTASKMNELLTEWDKMKTGRAASSIITSYWALPAISYDPSEMANLLAKMTPAQANKIITQASEQLDAATRARLVNQQQSNQVAKAIASVQQELITKQAAETATRLAAQNKTATQIQQAVKTQVQAQIKAITQPAIRTQLSQKTELITRTATSTAPAPRVQITTPAPANIPFSSPAKIPTPKKPPPVKKIPPPPPFVKLSAKEKEKKKKLLDKKGSIAWRQGFVWYIIKHPYASKNDVSVSRKAPRNALVVSGVGSAYQTIQRLVGKAPIDLFIDMGIMDIHIKRTGRQQLKMTVKRDIRQKTKGDISLKGVRV